MVWRVPSEVGGYVLAGGKSSRMGRDKAFLELAGKPLALHAVVKLRRVCRDVHILSNNRELDAFAPLVLDLHEGCGPLSGLEAALEHSRHEWNLIMPVDMPFLPSAFLDRWVRLMLRRQKEGVRVAIFTVGGYPQPALCMLHQDVKPYLSRALQRGAFKLFPLFEAVGKELAVEQGLPPGKGFFNWPWRNDQGFSVTHGPVPQERESWWTPTEAQQKIRHLWFANLNTPEEFAEAERHLDALDT
jgi:molybdopterin-guanine dinucleotide biosynthesis protein A